MTKIIQSKLSIKKICMPVRKGNNYQQELTIFFYRKWYYVLALKTELQQWRMYIIESYMGISDRYLLARSHTTFYCDNVFGFEFTPHENSAKITKVWSKYIKIYTANFRTNGDYANLELIKSDFISIIWRMYTTTEFRFRSLRTLRFRTFYALPQQRCRVQTK